MMSVRAAWICMTVILGTLLVIAPQTAPAQKKKGAAPKQTKGKSDSKNGAAAKEAEYGDTKAPFLPDVDFDSGTEPSSEDTPVTQDRDETPEGRQRVREIESRAKQIFQQSEVVMEKRRPFALDRDARIGGIQMEQAANVQDQQTWDELDVQAAQIKQQVPFAKGDMLQQLRNQLANIQMQGAFLQNRMAERQKTIAGLVVKINELNLEIQPFDEQLQKLWQELTEARKQWIEQRQPLEKYGRGDFEALQSVLDAWLLIDGLWPNAFAWAALCSVELRDYAKAAAYLEKVEKIPTEAGRQSRYITVQLSALTGLVKSKLPGQSGKAAKAIETALRDVDKKNGWETYFLVGRYYVDRERELRKAKANLEKSLKIKPNCPGARLWLARIQTTSSNDDVRDLKAGTKTLETLWHSTGQRSWRLGYFLFEAFHRGRRSADANRIWEKTLELAPSERHEQIKKDRTALLASTSAPE